MPTRWKVPPNIWATFKQYYHVCIINMIWFPWNDQWTSSVLLKLHCQHVCVTLLKLQKKCLKKICDILLCNSCSLWSVNNYLYSCLIDLVHITRQFCRYSFSFCISVTPHHLCLCPSNQLIGRDYMAETTFRAKVLRMQTNCTMLRKLFVKDKQGHTNTQMLMWQHQDDTVPQHVFQMSVSLKERQMALQRLGLN